MQKELSLAFVWHFHQPNYQTQPNGIRLMPWARLHAVKDYLDMLLIMDKYPKLKLNFSLVPPLLDAIEDYSLEGHDIHSKLTVTPVEELSNDDKLYILNYFFDANYDSLISKNPRYNELYLKRYNNGEVNINDFTLQEYSDIMFLFNFIWFDPIWKNVYKELDELQKKERNYTLEDRCLLIELNRKIIRQIIPTFKKYQDEGKIEIITAPYNHPILPILINSNDLKKSSLKHPMPDCKITMVNDAKDQIKLAWKRIKDIFGQKPQGLWPSEHCISQKTLDVMADLGVKWVITDESVLSNSIKKEFVRDFRGCYEDPYEVCSTYTYKTKQNKGINLIFRDSVIPNLISFEYPHHDNILCANDLFDKIKTIHDKLKNSPDKSHLFTIAMDGENSWDSYVNDGALFLNRLYSLINDDKNIKTVLISDYINSDKTKKKSLKSISSGSWANQEFQLWIAEPTKNVAWKYLIQTRNDLKAAIKEKYLTKEEIKSAKSEIYIAEGSDWFWWYGEPNNSGQDHIFDFLFREHLKNVYSIIKKPIPAYLEMPLISFVGKPLKNPKKEITPLINGIISGNDEWRNAGCINIPDGPVLQGNKLFNRIYFGQDKNNLYLRFDLNKYILESTENLKEFYSVYIYIKAYDKAVNVGSPVRTTIKANSVLPVLLDKYTHEIRISLKESQKYSFQYSGAKEDGLWELTTWRHHIRYVNKEIIEVAIPFDDIGILKGEKFDFFFLAACNGVTEEVYPKDIPLTLSRN